MIRTDAMTRSLGLYRDVSEETLRRAMTTLLALAVRKGATVSETMMVFEEMGMPPLDEPALTRLLHAENVDLPA